jgi:hypothetical protein
MSISGEHPTTYPQALIDRVRCPRCRAGRAKPVTECTECHARGWLTREEFTAFCDARARGQGRPK